MLKSRWGATDPRKSDRRRVIARNPRHRLLQRIWLVLFAFVGIQTGWVLRPFLGQPNLPAQFLRSNAWENAYVEMAAKVRRVLSH